MDVRVQYARDKLLAEEVEVPAGEVEQRADVGIVLTVVITERTLVVALKLRNTVVRAHLPASGERFIDFELHCLILADRIYEAIRNAVSAVSPSNLVTGCIIRI